MPRHSSRPFNRQMAVLVYDGLCMFEFACAAEVFGLARPEAGPDWYRFKTVSLNGKSIQTQYGGRLVPQSDAAALKKAGTILIPGWKSPDTPVPRGLIQALRDAHARGARLMSICSGVFVLAATGLLDGQRATTHWRYASRLSGTYPAISVDPDVLYVDSGQILTSAGSAAGLDLCLHLVRRDFGSAMANQVARRLVIPPHRDGGQAQFVERPVSQHGRDGLSPLLDQLQRTLDKPHDIPTMARKVNMSERTFIRHFKAATAQTPAHWLLEQRLQLARDLLEQSRLSIEVIAQRSGFGSVITLRRHFRERLHTSPVAYRKRFEVEVPRKLGKRL
jgi:AraC family transcriptional regulator, transcriptional activator FtrA